MVRLKYEPVESELHRMQSFVNYMMLEVILKAPKMEMEHFSTNMVIPRYQGLIDGVNDKYLLEPLKIMYDRCRSLKPYQLKVLRKAVYNNNRIKELCEGHLKPVHYSELENVLGEENKDLLEAIKTFCYALYDQCLRRKPFKDKYEDIGQYYKKMVGRDSDCIMCGYMYVIETELDDAMSAFDHFLPRALYPFNSVNMDNLVPTCDACNEKYKKSKDPLFVSTPYDKTTRMRCFYPFSENSYPIIIKVTFGTPYIQDLPKEAINIDLRCEGNQDRVDNWDRIYHIKRRYRSFMGSADSYKFYLFIRNEAITSGIPMSRLIELREKNMEGDMNFLRVPFLKAVMESRK